MLGVRTNGVRLLAKPNCGLGGARAPGIQRVVQDSEGVGWIFDRCGGMLPPLSRQNRLHAISAAELASRVREDAATVLAMTPSERDRKGVEIEDKVRMSALHWSEAAKVTRSRCPDTDDRDARAVDGDGG